MPSTAKKKRVSPAWKKWQGQLQRAKELVAEYEDPDAFSMHGPRWLASMADHYKKVQQRLERNEPTKFLGD